MILLQDRWYKTQSMIYPCKITVISDHISEIWGKRGLIKSFTFTIMRYQEFATKAKVFYSLSLGIRQKCTKQSIANKKYFQYLVFSCYASIVNTAWYVSLKLVIYMIALGERYSRTTTDFSDDSHV